MKVLIAHNRYQQAGGEDRVVAAEYAMLASRGHAVERFDVNNDGIRGFAGKVQSAAASFYSFASASALRARLKSFRPQIVHVHNYHPVLSPAVFRVAKEEGAAVIFTLHNYRLICPSANLFRDGHSCTECLDTASMWPGVQHGCYHSSRVGTAVIGAGILLHSALGTWSRSVDRCVALSQYSASLFAQNRIPAERTRIKPNFIAERAVGYGGGGYALFVGRLAPEKGIQTLIDCDARGGLALPIVIVGDGPMMPALQAAANCAGSQLRVVGRQSPEQVAQWMRQANVILVPSTWHEPFGLTVIESFASGTPVIATSMGALPELVQEGVTGYITAPADTIALQTRIAAFARATPRTAEMRMAARQCFEQNYTEEMNYQMLMRIYEEVA